MKVADPISQAARAFAADLLDTVSSLLDHVGIGQVADLIRDGEYDEHDILPIVNRFEQAIRADQRELGARKCLEVSGLIGAGMGSSIDSALREAATAIRSQKGEK